MLKLIVTPVLFFSVLAQAEIMVFTGDAGQKLTMEKSTEIHRDTWVVKLEGVESEWAGKPILVAVQKSEGSDDGYVIDWKKKVDGKTDWGKYRMIIPGNGTLVNGTITKTMDVYYKGGDHNNPLVVTYNKEATAAAKSGLVKECQAKCFQPVP